MRDKRIELSKKIEGECVFGEKTLVVPYDVELYVYTKVGSCGGVPQPSGMKLRAGLQNAEANRAEYDFCTQLLYKDMREECLLLFRPLTGDAALERFFEEKGGKVTLAEMLAFEREQQFKAWQKVATSDPDVVYIGKKENK